MFKKSVAALLAVLLFITLGAAVYAQSVPALPALCYGELRINGNAAPVGTLVVAKVDGVKKGELISEETGWYGGPGLASKLAVTHEGSTGKMVKFYISGSYSGINFNDVFAGEAPYWGSGNVKQINLAIQVDSSGGGPAPAPDPGTGTPPPSSPPPSDGTPPPSDPVKAPEPDPVTGVVFGDINKDGFINVQDVSLVLQHALGYIELDLVQKEAADVNGDGIINVLDVVLISQYALELIDSFD